MAIKQNAPRDEVKVSRRLAMSAAAIVSAGAVFGSRHAEAEDDGDILKAAKAEGSVMFYSNFTQADNETAANLFNKKYGINVSIFRGETYDLLTRYDLEVKSGRVAVDVLALADVFASADLQKKGRLMKYRPPSTLEEGFDHRFAGDYFQHAGLTIWPSAWNSDLVTGANLPTDFSDFLKPFWRDRLAIQDAEIDPVGTQYYYILRKVLGVEFCRRLAAQRCHLLHPNNVIAEHIISGEMLGAPLLISNVARQMTDKGAPLGVGFMKTGTPVLARTVQIAKAAPQPNAAKLFVNFLLSQEGQTEFQQEARSLSPRTDVKIEGLPSLHDVKALSIEDVGDYLNNRKALQQEFAKLFKNS